MAHEKGGQQHIEIAHLLRCALLYWFEIDGVYWRRSLWVYGSRLVQATKLLAQALGWVGGGKWAYRYTTMTATTVQQAHTKHT